MLYYKRGFLRVVEFWFDETNQCPSADIIRHFQKTSPSEGCSCVPFHTLVTDLRQEPDTILAKIKKDTRYEIRRAAEKDRLSYCARDSVDAETLAHFLDFHSRFAAAKGLRPANRIRLQLLAEIGALYLSEALGADGSSLVWHAYCRFQDRARLLYSASHLHAAGDKSLIGRANRYLHWRDFLALQALGIKLYDFGGWYEGTQDAKKIRINQFKAEFGGELVVNFNILQGATWKGKLGLWVYQKLVHD
jgi:hypothetical protein